MAQRSDLVLGLDYLQRTGTSSYGQEAMHHCTTVNYKTFAAG